MELRRGPRRSESGSKLEVNILGGVSTRAGFRLSGWSQACSECSVLGSCSVERDEGPETKTPDPVPSIHEVEAYRR